VLCLIGKRIPKSEAGPGCESRTKVYRGIAMKLVWAAKDGKGRGRGRGRRITAAAAAPVPESRKEAEHRALEFCVSSPAFSKR